MTNYFKQTVAGAMTMLLFHRQSHRGMSLLPCETRCVAFGEIHELVTTNDINATMGSRIDNVGFLGFMQVVHAGVIARGDVVWFDGRCIGTVLGFDGCHFPNHYNIMIGVHSPVTATEINLTIGCVLTFSAAIGQISAVPWAAASAVADVEEVDPHG